MLKEIEAVVMALNDIDEQYKDDSVYLLYYYVQAMNSIRSILAIGITIDEDQLH